MDYSITSTTLDVYSVFNLHSIINNGLILGGQNSSKRQTVLFLPIDPRDKHHENPEHIDFFVLRRARFVRSASKKHKDAVFCVDIDFAIKKGIDILSNTIECNCFSTNTSSLLCSKSCGIEDWRKFIKKKSYVSPRRPPKISLRHDHDLNQREL